MMLGVNYTVSNFGVGGSTISLQSEVPYLNQTEFQNAKKFMPNYVIIMLGTNDAFPSRQNYLGNFTGDYEKIVYEFQAISTKPKIFIVLPPPIFNNSLGPDNTILVEDVVPRIKEVATELGLPTINVYAPLVDHSTYFWDGVHPNSEGAKIIATQIYNAIA
jgi:alpha-L-fucosidase 2